MELLVALARASHTSIEFFLKLPIRRLLAWTKSVEQVLKKENESYER